MEAKERELRVWETKMIQDKRRWEANASGQARIELTKATRVAKNPMSMVYGTSAYWPELIRAKHRP